MLEIATATHAGMTTGSSRDRDGLDRHREAPHDRARLHRDGLSADARAARTICALTAFKTFIVPEAESSHASVDREGLRHSTTASRGQPASGRRSRCAEKPVLARLPEVSFIDDGPGSPLASTSASAAARSPRSATPTATSRCCQWVTAGPPAFAALRPPHRCRREWAYDRESSVGRLNRARRGERHGAGRSST